MEKFYNIHICQNWDTIKYHELSKPIKLNLNKVPHNKFLFEICKIINIIPENADLWRMDIYIIRDTIFVKYDQELICWWR